MGLGLIYKGRLVCFYDFECDLGDGWEDADVHNDSKETRIKLLKWELIFYPMCSGKITNA